ncbi:MAG TPA: extracellular solute-binding protein [Gammaproteobacteria bacterium]|nr:extracellular solute-binding protein [Gammaproteobacteria bacterium]
MTMRLRAARNACLWLTLASVALSGGTALARPTLRVAYAGSMGTVMDRNLGPAFAKGHGADYQGIGHGAYGLARLLASKHMRADVFVSVTPGPMRILIERGLVDHAVPVASTRMVIAYNPNSRFAPDFRAAARGKQKWYEVLQEKGLRFGRTDPATDPQGRNIVFTFQLAERYYHRPGLVKKILGSPENPKQIFAESALITRLESGQIDASSGYRSAVVSRGLPYVSLPPQIDLSRPGLQKSWYRKAGFRLKGKTGKPREVHPQPLVFYAAVLNNAANPKAGRQFVKFMQSAKGQAMLRKDGYGPPHGSVLR